MRVRLRNTAKITNTPNHRVCDQSELIAHLDPVMPVLDGFPGLSTRSSSVATLGGDHWSPERRRDTERLRTEGLWCIMVTFPLVPIELFRELRISSFDFP